MALAKGGLTPDHVLIIPMSHCPSSFALSEETKNEILKFKTALKNGNVIFFFF